MRELSAAMMQNKYRDKCICHLSQYVFSISSYLNFVSKQKKDDKQALTVLCMYIGRGKESILIAAITNCIKNRID